MAVGTTTVDPDWSRVANSTIKDYIKGEEPNVLRRRKLLALMQSKGRMSYNHSGTSMDWKVRYRRVPLKGRADGDTSTFAREERHMTANLGWRGYEATDSMTKGEYLKNRGKEQIIKLFDTRLPMLMEDVSDGFSEQLYVDGTMTNNLKFIHGLETIFGSTPATGNGAMIPSANYAGISCVPGAYNGTWASNSPLTWPHGKGSAQYDFWSPLIIDVGDSWTQFNQTTHTWEANCVEAVAFAIIHSQSSPASDGKIDLFLLNKEAYQIYIKQLRSLQRIVVDNSSSPLRKLGFTDFVQQDGGYDITFEFGLPTANDVSNSVGVIGYGLNLSQLELRSQQSTIWVPDGPDWDIATASWRWKVDFYGNLVINPKYQCKLYNATVTTDPAQM